VGLLIVLHSNATPHPTLRSIAQEWCNFYFQALFFDVTAEKADQDCSTFLLPQCGQAIFSLSCRAMVKIFENVFLQPLQKNS
jgi:hypothetical protein